ncbi:hypothetical protein OSB04_016860 [Centaurea solstitialis]|uniref:Amidase domain-containing protein n=1 Tax=Centaurea solstitialis TaxID=347529 RepID=A0AA38WHV4_9ASTR|nr:hypothetical protein OSB04_016860 [Centaurea solstitialis]
MIGVTRGTCDVTKAAFGTWDRTGQDGTKLTVPRLAQHGTEQEFTVPRLVRHGTGQKLGQGGTTWDKKDFVAAAATGSYYRPPPSRLPLQQLPPSPLPLQQPPPPPLQLSTITYHHRLPPLQLFISTATTTTTHHLHVGLIKLKMASSSSPNLWVLLGLSLAGILLMAKKLKKAIKPDFGAFVQNFQILPPPQPAPPKAPHPLTGLSFAVSDLFDINGFVTGFGNPDWERTHEAASQTSPVVSALVDGGATCVGKTVVDEMSFGISGENRYYGTPTNPVAPARIPGGSCSGAAVAVAAKLVDFSLADKVAYDNHKGCGVVVEALGDVVEYPICQGFNSMRVDTVGGVRQPAGHCGILGFRPSYGAVSHLGIIPVSTSFDTVGWFAMDPSILRRVGQVLLPVPFAVQRNPRNVVIADDCFQLSKIPIDRLTQVVIRSTENLFGKQVLKHEILGDYIASKVPSLKALDSKKSNGDIKFSSLRSLANIMQLLRRHEFSHNHFEWIQKVKPALDPLISAQVQERSELSEKDIENFRTVKSELRSALNTLLKDDGILVIPTVSSPPSKLGAKELSSEDHLMSEFLLTSLASMSGCCQVTVPLGLFENYPVSVSFLARHGGDRFLLDTLQTMHASLLQKADEAGKAKSSGDVVTKEASAEIAKEKGNNAFKAKNWQRAVGFYTDAIKLNSNNAAYFNNRAAAYLELGSFIQAEADCSKAIELDKKNVKAYLRRGTAREMLGYYKEAIEDFRYALVLEPTNKRAAVSADRLKKLFQ